MEKTINIKKYIDRAMDEVNKETFEVIKILSPKVMTILLIDWGRSLCEQDEFEKIVKPLKPKWYQFWRKKPGNDATKN